MKKILFLLLLTPFAAFSQKGYNPQPKLPPTVPSEDLLKSITDSTGTVSITEVVHVDTSLKKDDLYRNTKSFFAEYFKSSKDVVQYDDREEGKVIGKGNFPVSDKNLLEDCDWNVNFSIELICKDGKYKYKIYNVNILEEVTTYDPKRTTLLHSSVSDVYDKTHKGMYKGMYSRLFGKMCDGFKSLASQIKNDVNKKIIKDDF